MRSTFFSFAFVFLAPFIAPTITGAQEEVADRDDQKLEERIRRLEEIIEERGLEEPSPETFRFFWKNGLRIESMDGSFKFKLGGRIQNDWAFYESDSKVEAVVGKIEDGTEFRRARFYLSGTIHDRVYFKAQYDFADGDADFKDVYMGLKGIPYIGHIQVGHFKEPFSLAQLTSSKYISFMERSIVDEEVEGRNTGFMVFNDILDERGTWAIGLFQRTDNFGNASNETDFNVTGRLTALPWYEDKGRRLFHAGVGLTHRSPHNRTAIDPTDGSEIQVEGVQINTPPESHLAPDFLDTSVFRADSVNGINLESALVMGPLSVQGEYTHIAISGVPGGSDPDFGGWYVQLTYFLTGEHRHYDLGKAVFGRTKPKTNFLGPDGGGGAWEVGARYSSLDLNDGVIRGGELDDVTLGLNWYLNPNTRVMWNFIYADLRDAGRENIFQMRFQIDF